MSKRILQLLLCLLCGATLCSSALAADIPSQAGSNSLITPYIDENYFRELHFGESSHWLQPWRSYLETTPAHHFINGIGINVGAKNDISERVLLEMLSRYGFKRVRLHIAWANLNYDTEEVMTNSNFEEYLTAAKDFGLRPTILLWCHHGNPCPQKVFNRTFLEDAPAGATQIVLDRTDDLVVNYSGMVREGVAARYLITAINGNTVTLSRPLDEAVSAGTKKKFHILKYRPFGPPGSASHEETVEGWKHYVKTVAKYCRDHLGTHGADDPGFDMEIWNEMTFGSHFSNIEKYYSPVPPELEHGNRYFHNPGNPDGLVQRTVEVVEEEPELFKGVEFSDSFGNTLPWPAAEDEPAAVTSIGKHPYISGKEYPQGAGTWINAHGQTDTWEPTYRVESIPEFYGTYLRTETFIWDTHPGARRYWGNEPYHGRFGRGSDNPVWVYMTELGVHPDAWYGVEGVENTDLAHRIKAKFSLRAFSFILGKGARCIELYSAKPNSEGDGFGLLKRNFWEYAQENDTYPTDDSNYVSDTLHWVSRTVDQMQAGGVDDSLTMETTRPIAVENISDDHNQIIFSGNTDDAGPRPNLYHRDRFVIQPYQVNADRFVLPYYVMTNDLSVDLPEEVFTVDLSGIDGTKAISVYDPTTDSAVDYAVVDATSNSLSINLAATDYPRLLIIDESGDSQDSDDDDDDTTGPTIETGKWYRLKNLQYNKYLDTQSNGALRVEPNGTSDGATWQFEDAGEGYYYIDAKKEGRGYLDTSSNHVVSWKDFSTSDGHKWLPIALDDGTFRFANKKNGREYLVADSDDSVKWNDGQTGSDSQWILIEVTP